ncbi:type II toxin-antitoxin system RelE/ParE family toxin [Rhizobium halophilum]|uniref:type II toxin-antitoxin system RelE/ParE family toxin n=1 Tax=Rhizobium halophilum TaxID=2846852 RepID=UPI001EFD63A4|nr:type II toxin-antitoxin system RelE/ParE family toxin [Rhizobium halophilum]MCF6367891.1 type II toxin-antitoxin system RelE/ParE family toxin [Rhizobium halophilum]
MWVIRLSAAAQNDIVQILIKSSEDFGAEARSRYERLIVAALRDIAEDPLRNGSVAREELGRGVRSFHLRNSRERSRDETGRVRVPRHFILYRCSELSIIGIGRVLHDAMEVQRHLPRHYGDEAG